MIKSKDFLPQMEDIHFYFGVNLKVFCVTVRETGESLCPPKIGTFIFIPLFTSKLSGLVFGCTLNQIHLGLVIPEGGNNLSVWFHLKLWRHRVGIQTQEEETFSACINLVKLNSLTGEDAKENELWSVLCTCTFWVGTITYKESSSSLWIHKLLSSWQRNDSPSNREAKDKHV